MTSKQNNLEIGRDQEVFVHGNGPLDDALDRLHSGAMKLHLNLRQTLNVQPIYDCIATSTSLVAVNVTVGMGSQPNELRLLGQAMACNVSVQMMEVNVLQLESDATLVQLFSFLAQNNHLKELVVRSDFISPTVVQALGEGLKHNTSVERLRISTKSSLAGLFPFLAHNKAVQYLLLFTPLSLTDIQALVTSLQHNRSVRTVGFNSNSPQGIGLLGDCLKYSQSINEVIYSQSAVEDPYAFGVVDADQLQRFADGLKANDTVISLDLGFVVNGSLESLCSYIRSTNTLSSLRAYLGHSSPTTHHELCQALIHNTSVTTLHLSANSTATSYIDLMQHNKKITSLQLVSDFTAASFTTIKEALGRNKSITSLELSGDTTTEGLQAIKEALIVNDTLREVFVPHEQNQPSYFSDIMKHNKTIRKIDISTMVITDLIDMINATSSLTDLTVMDRHCIYEPSAETLAELRRALEMNQSLTRVKLRRTINNTVGYLEWAAEFCERNITLQKQRYEDTALIMHVIARSCVFPVLPVELWQAIFSSINYPGLLSFDVLFKTVFTRTSSAVVGAKRKLNDDSDLVSASTVKRQCVTTK